MRMFRRLQAGLAVVTLLALVAPTWSAESDKFLPGSTNVVVTLNVKQLLESALVKKFDGKIKDAIKNDANAKKILEDLGLDPFKDVDSVVVGGTGGKEDDVLILVAGRFSRAKMEAKAEEVAKGDQGLKITKEGNYKVYEMTGKDGKTGFGAILNDNTLAFSPKKDYVVEALDKQAGKKKADLKKDLTTLLDKADTKQSVTMVALGSGLGADQDFADKIKTVTGGINITDEIKMAIEMAAKDDKSAKAVAEELDKKMGEVKTLVGFMAASDARFAPLVDVVKTLKISATGSTISLKGDVTKAVIDNLLKNLPQ